jgi:iron complex outermembrane receptor protein
MDFKSSVDFQNYEISLGVYNLLNSRSLASVTINDKTPVGGASVYDYTNRPNSLDQYYYQPSRSFQVSVTANF